MPPVLSAGGGGRGGGGGEGWAVVSTGGTTATGGSAAGVSEDTNWKKGNKTDLDGKKLKEKTPQQRRMSRTQSEKRRGTKKMCGEREAGKMSITLTPKHSSLFRWMSQGLKHDLAFKPSLFIRQHNCRYTHTSNLSKHFHHKHKTPLFQRSQSPSLSPLAFLHH